MAVCISSLLSTLSSSHLILLVKFIYWKAEIVRNSINNTIMTQDKEVV